uniref:Uncharacterized protein n=1 Tax=Ditylenchus dipsaci TaxID=166011 RepID=A0A915ESM5_9BILA
MDFDKLLAKAGSNVKKHSEKVREADLEMEIDRQRKLQRLAIQKRTEREEIKRKAPPKSESPKQRCFVIPKKAQKAEPEVDKEKLAKFLNRQEQEKRQKEIKKQKEKDELIRLRLESMGGKANKKLSKQFGKSPIELQIRYGNNSEHADILMKQQQREEEEQERLAALYRQGVSKAVQHKNKIVAKLSSSSSNKNEGSSKVPSTSNHRPESSSRPTTAPNKRPPVPASAIKSSASSNKSSTTNGGLAERKRKVPEMEDFQLLMKKAQHNRELIEKGGFPEDLPPQPKLIRRSLDDERSISKKDRQYPSMHENVSRDRPLPKHKDSFKTPFDPVPSKSFASRPNHSLAAQPSSSSKSFKTPQLPQPSSSKLSRPQQPVIKSNEKGDRSNMVSRTSQEQLEPLERPKKTIVVDPETGTVNNKKYLPGDIRYKGGPSAPPPPSVQKKIAPIKSMQEAAPKPRREENGFTKAVNASKPVTNSASGQRRPQMDSARPSSSTSSNPKTSKFKTEEEMRSEIERRRREARLMEKMLEQRRVQSEQREMDISLNKIKRMRG